MTNANSESEPPDPGKAQWWYRRGVSDAKKARPAMFRTNGGSITAVGENVETCEWNDAELLEYGSAYLNGRDDEHERMDAREREEAEFDDRDAFLDGHGEP